MNTLYIISKATSQGLKTKFFHARPAKRIRSPNWTSLTGHILHARISKCISIIMINMKSRNNYINEKNLV